MQMKLYELRKKSKLSQKEVADFLGITRISYGQKERGTSQFQQDEMFKLANMFRKPISEIFLPRSNQNGYKDEKEA